MMIFGQPGKITRNLWHTNQIISPGFDWFLTEYHHFTNRNGHFSVFPHKWMSSSGIQPSTFWVMNSLRTNGDFYHQKPPITEHRNCPKNLRLSKPTDMTIHWKDLEEHFLMVALVFRFNHFRGENAFSVFFLKNLSLNIISLILLSVSCPSL
jgi:hypothetical protein